MNVSNENPGFMGSNESMAELEKYWTKIRSAVEISDHQNLNVLLNNAKFNAINNECFGESALDLAASKGDEMSVLLLLAYGAIPDYNESQHIWPKTTLSRAIQGGNRNVIKLLVDHGCDPDAILKHANQQKVFSFYDYWCAVIEKNNLPMFECLLECKNRLIRNDEWSQNQLLTACIFGSSDIIEYLLDQGVSVETTGNNNWTCLFYAMHYKKFSIIELLINRGANVEHKDSKGRSLLHIFITLNSIDFLEIVQLLIDHGLDINATDDKNQTPINAAFDNFCTTYLLSFLLKQPGIDLSLPGIDGTTVLHRVIASEYYNLLDIVLCNPTVNINARDQFGRTPLQIIKFSRALIDHLSLLLDFEADTRVLTEGLLRETILKNKSFLQVLGQYRLKRKVACLSKDLNVESILAEASRSLYRMFSITEPSSEVSMYSKEIQMMKETIIYDKFTCYDLLRLKKRYDCIIKLVNKPEIMVKEKFDNYRTLFPNYGNMLYKNYLKAARPLTSLESEAINLVDTNFLVISNNKLPNLVIHNIKKYIDIDDMINLYKAVKLAGLDNYLKEKSAYAN